MAACPVRKDDKNENRSLTLKAEGNEYFKTGDYLQALDCYTRALQSCPEPAVSTRAILYNNRAACCIHSGRFEEAIEDSSESIVLNPEYVKAYVRRATAYEHLSQPEDALKDLTKALELDPKSKVTEEAHARVDLQVKEKQEKMKEEMMGKLKDFGNTLLGKFGMSTDNFQMVQDPNSGSYNINFKQ